jgi:hypothetical protein
MSIKEFSEKNSVVLFYTTAILIVAVVILVSMSFGHKGLGRRGPSNFQGNNQPKMMQNDVNIPGQNNQDQAQNQIQ